VARQVPPPRKQRTRQHVIADLSRNHVERFILDEGHTVQRQESDYGYDLHLTTYDGQGYVEPGSVYLQLKAAERLRLSGTDHVFDVDIRDYNLWMAELSPVYLILYDASLRRAFWLPVQHYFRADPARRPRKGARTVRVRIPIRQAVNRRAVRRMRAAKLAVLAQV
jgi:hypothetical protein